MNNCTSKLEQTVLSQEYFGEVSGKSVSLYSIKFPDRLEAKITNYGATITSLKVPDRNGVLEDIVLGFDSLRNYQDRSPYFGSVIGRYGNRIAGGEFKLNGNNYKLTINNGHNHLHGGARGFDKVVWDVVDIVENEDSVKLTFKYASKDGEEGYPGDLDCLVIYTFKPNGFSIAYEATTNKTTIVNLTNHSYFNLSGDLNKDILDHELHINAREFLPVDSSLIPSGEFRPVQGTSFDFSTPKRIGQHIDDNAQQLQFGSGYDHCWVLSRKKPEEMIHAATLYHAASGRILDIYTREPGIQFYSGNFLDGSVKGKDGINYPNRSGLCLETQHFPDSPNHDEFPSTVLKPGERFTTVTRYEFGTR